jgi:hypothetical protein
LNMSAQNAGIDPVKNGAGESAGLGDFKREATAAASSAREAASAYAENARSSANEYAAAGAQALKDAADQGSSQLAGAFRGAADRLGAMSDTMRDTSLSEVMESLGSFAARRPVAFFGCGVLAGVILSRLFGPSDR